MQCIEQHVLIKLKHRACVHLHRHVDESQFLCRVALNEALEDFLAQKYIVPAVLSKFSFCLRLKDGQSIRRIYGSPFGGKTKIAGKFRE